MKQERLAAKLDALIEAGNRPQIARLREVFDRVEKAMAAGIRRSAILEVLREEGLTFTPKSFESALHQIRKERREAALRAPAASSTPPEPQTAVTPTAPPTDPSANSPPPPGPAKEERPLSTRQKREEKLKKYFDDY